MSPYFSFKFLNVLIIGTLLCVAGCGEIRDDVDGIKLLEIAPTAFHGEPAAPNHPEADKPMRVKTFDITVPVNLLDAKYVYEVQVADHTEVSTQTAKPEPETNTETEVEHEFDPELNAAQEEFVRGMLFAQTESVSFYNGILMAREVHEGVQLGYFDEEMHLQRLETVVLSPNARWTLVKDRHLGALVEISSDQDTFITARFFDNSGEFTGNESSMILDGNPHTEFSMQNRSLVVTAVNGSTLAQHLLSPSGNVSSLNEHPVPEEFEEDQVIRITQQEGHFLIQYVSGTVIHATEGRCGQVFMQDHTGEPLSGDSGFVWDQATERFWGYAGFEHDMQQHIMRSFEPEVGFTEREVEIESLSYATPVPVSTAQGIFLVYPSPNGISAQSLDSETIFFGHSDSYFSNVQKAWPGPRGESIIALGTARCNAGLVRIPLVTNN